MSLYFTQEHEWIAVDGDVGTVGITDFAQGQLGDITFVELPLAGRTVAKGEAVSVVDSVKAASDVYIDGNPMLEGAPELVNADPEAGGWLFRVKLADAAELDGLMDRAAYDAFVAGL
jgi:glycine cleavage system H protein